jgi:multidrug efflux pump subunit AcrA (membrane-fusion protein)
MATLETIEKPGPTMRPRTRPKAKSRLWLWISLVIVVGGIATYAYMKSHSSNDAGKMITAPVTRGDLIESVTATGSVTAQTGAEVKIGSQITGVIKRLHADVGTYVNKGDLIAELDLPDLQAQLDQSQANLLLAQTKYAQQLSGVGMVRTQSSSSVVQAQAGVFSAQQKLVSAQAAAREQSATTPNDIKRAQTAVATAQSTLSTAKSALAQVQAGANLQVATAQEQLQQAQANTANSAAALARLQSLLAKGYESQANVDVAQAQAAVNQSQVRSAQQNIQLVQQKVTADLQAAKDQVNMAQQGVASAQAALTSAQAGTYTVASRNADVQDAQAAVQQAQANLAAAKGNIANDVLKSQDVTQAEESVKSAEAQVAYYQAEAAKAMIRSPISGTVLQLSAQQGETLAAGLSAPTLIIVADLKRLEIDAFVDETDIGKLKLGQKANCTVDAFPDQSFKGKVIKIASGSTIQQGVVTYDVTVAIEDPSHVLKPDMTATVTIQTGKRTNVTLVPSVAVQVGTKGSTVNVLTKKDGQSTSSSVPVVTGGTDGVNTEIVSGVNVGDTIIVAGAPSASKRQGSSSPFGQRAGGGGGGGGGGRGGG